MAPSAQFLRVTGGCERRISLQKSVLMTRRLRRNACLCNFFFLNCDNPSTTTTIAAMMGVRVGGQGDNKKMGLECMYFHTAAHICAARDRRHIVAARSSLSREEFVERGQHFGRGVFAFLPRQSPWTCRGPRTARVS